jgi:tRNA1Val (adenine37-N6)-methyltransferase
VSTTTLDPILRGALLLEQPSRGYRFNVDALLLAAFAEKQFADSKIVVDLGAGCGVVGLLLARHLSHSRAYLVELQRPLARLARANVRRNQLDSRVAVVEGDLRQLHLCGDNTLVVSNPPFFRRQSGRVSADLQIAQAKHELTATLRDVVSACARCAGRSRPGNHGHAAIIHLFERRDELLGVMAENGLVPIVEQWVRPLPGRPPARVIIGARCSKALSDVPEPVREADLVIHDKPGKYTAAMLRILGDASEAEALDMMPKES